MLLPIIDPDDPHLAQADIEAAADLAYQHAIADGTPVDRDSFRLGFVAGLMSGMRSVVERG